MSSLEVFNLWLSDLTLLIDLITSNTAELRQMSMSPVAFNRIQLYLTFGNHQKNVENFHLVMILSGTGIWCYSMPTLLLDIPQWG